MFNSRLGDGCKDMFNSGLVTAAKIFSIVDCRGGRPAGMAVGRYAISGMQRQDLARTTKARFGTHYKL